MNPHDIGLVLALVLAGAASGVINVMAGGGSYLTMALLRAGGLDINVANGTIRPGILAQNLMAMVVFRKHSLVAGPEILRWSLPVILGALLGSKVASDTPPQQFQILMIPLVLIGCWPLLSEFFPRLQKKKAVAPAHWKAWIYFFVAGTYGGLIQAGVGFLLLGAARYAGHDLRSGNALKVALTLVLGVPSMLIFLQAGQIHALAAFWLAVGTTLGSYWGADWVATKDLRWVKVLLLVGIFLFLLQLALT